MFKLSPNSNQSADNSKSSAEKMDYKQQQTVYNALVAFDQKYKQANPSAKDWEQIKSQINAEKMSHQKLVSSLNRYRYYLSSRGQSHLLCGKKRSYR